MFVAQSGKAVEYTDSLQRKMSLLNECLDMTLNNLMMSFQ